MSRSIGRLIFVFFIWVYSLFYYLECLDLEDASENMTITAVFWGLTVFVVLELFNLITAIRSDPDLKHPFSRQALVKIIKDSKTHLVAVIIIYLLAIPSLGFYLSSFFAFCAFSFILGNRGLFKTIVPALVVLAVNYLTFSYSLKLVLPSGLFF